MSANKIGQQKSVVCHLKIGRLCLPIKSADLVVQYRTRSILDDKIGELCRSFDTPLSYFVRLCCSNEAVTHLALSVCKAEKISVLRKSTCSLMKK